MKDLQETIEVGFGNILTVAGLEQLVGSRIGSFVKALVSC